jgi:hypothetical protein
LTFGSQLTFLPFYNPKKYRKKAGKRMAWVIKKSYDRVIALGGPNGYNETRKPDQQESRKATVLTSLVKILFLVVCITALILGGFQRATAQPAETAAKVEAGANHQQQLDRVSSFLSSNEPGGFLGEYKMSVSAQPGIWFGLAATLSGTLVFWSSVIMLARRRAY